MYDIIFDKDLEFLNGILILGEVLGTVTVVVPTIERIRKGYKDGWMFLLAYLILFGILDIPQ